jgi:lipoate-protein ligase A
VSASWTVGRLRASPGELHGLDLTPPDGDTPLGHGAWFLSATEPAMVLGSTQPDIDGVAMAVVRRRSGGGAVLVGDARSTWLDLVIPRASPLWHDDVGTAMHWVGEVWAAALADLEVRASVHRGAMRPSSFSRTICFAGLGPGEVVDAEGRKLVGIAQRRSRAGARFQTIAYHDDPVARVVDLLHLGADGPRARAELAATTSTLDVDPAALDERLVAHLPILG